jgi:general secretion pathway protein C
MFLQHFDPVRLSRAAAILALATGVGAWGSILLAPRAQGLPPMLNAPRPAGADTAAMARWFGKSAAPVKVTVLGLISAGPRGAAILAIDGGEPRAYRVGQAIADGVTLAKVERAGVVLDQAGASIQVAAPAEPALASPGFVPVP